MRDYKKLRDALRQIRSRAIAERRIGIAELAVNSLSETSPTSEMERLVEWLEAKKGTPANTPSDRGWESAFTVVLHHIHTEFGYKDAVLAWTQGCPKTSGGGWCYDCGHYRLTESEARAVSRELADYERLKIMNRLLTAAHAKDLDKLLAMGEKQPCGHERRFIVEGLTNFMGEDGITKWGIGWCALCAAYSKTYGGKP